MFREIRWTDWSEEHIARHGVTPEEVEEALLSRPWYATRAREDTLFIYGVTASGRHLIVCADNEGDGVAFIVTAREMTEKEKKTFRQKAR